MHRGYIKLWRCAWDHPFWNEPRPRTRREAWEDIIAMVNHAPTDVLIKNTVLHCGRGESLRSLEEWARVFRWSKSATRRFFSLLEKLGQIRLANETVTTRLSVCNYESYHGEPTQEPTQQAKRKRNASETQADTKQEDKNDKNDNKKRGNAPPTIAEVQDYCTSRNNGLDAQHFVDFYSARGWRFKTGQPVRDWRACVRTWEQRRKQDAQTNNDSNIHQYRGDHLGFDA